MCTEGPLPLLTPSYVYLGYIAIYFIFYSLNHRGERALAWREPMQRCRWYSPIRQASGQRARACLLMARPQGAAEAARMNGSIDLTALSDLSNIFAIFAKFYCDDFIVGLNRFCFLELCNDAPTFCRMAGSSASARARCATI